MGEAYLTFIPILAPTFPLSRLHSTDMEFLHHALGATVSHTSVFLNLQRRIVMNLFMHHALDATVSHTSVFLNL